MNKFLIFLLLSVTLLEANTLHVNSPLSELNTFEYKTPNGRLMKIPKTSKLVIIAFGKDTGATVNEYLNTKSTYYLQRNHSIYIADIHKMPSIITSMFALPKLRKYKHLIYLNYNENFEKLIPKEEEKITLLHVENGVVKNIEFIQTQEELRKAIDK